MDTCGTTPEATPSRTADASPSTSSCAGIFRAAEIDQRTLTATDSTWTPSSWRERTAAQQPEWPDRDALGAVRDRLHDLPSRSRPGSC